MIQYLYEVNRLRPQDGHQLPYRLEMVQVREAQRQADGDGHDPRV